MVLLGGARLRRGRLYTAEPSCFLQMLQGRFLGLLSAPAPVNPQIPGTLVLGTPWELTAPCPVHFCPGTLDVWMGLMCAYTLLHLHLAPACPWWGLLKDLPSSCTVQLCFIITVLFPASEYPQSSLLF